MNRFVAKLVQGSARLAFWRKRGAKLPLLVDQIVEADASPAQAPEAADTPDMSQPSPRLSLLARLKAMLRRKPKAEQTEATADTDASDTEEAVEAPTRDVESADEDEDAPTAGRRPRVLALLTSKRVLIPGVGVAVLAIMGTMTFMLVQSKQETEKLQADLLAAEKKIKQATVVKPDASSKAAMRQGVSMQADNPDHSSVASAADVQPGLSEGDCVVSNKESVTKNLKNCIEAFNAISR